MSQISSSSFLYAHLLSISRALASEHVTAVSFFCSSLELLLIVLWTATHLTFHLMTPAHRYQALELWLQSLVLVESSNQLHD
jgi:hypothetical protein